jgi:hypothetical protein
MYRSCLFLSFFFGVLIIAPAIGVPNDDLRENLVYVKPPRALVEFWLHFHEIGLCQSVHASFELNERGMKIKSLVEDEKSYQKLEDMLAPLRRSFQIELETSYPAVKEKDGKESDHENNPPPAIWENYELRSNLGDPIAKHIDREDLEGIRSSTVDTQEHGLLISRLYLFAVQTLDWNKKMEHYASDLSALTRISQDQSVDQDLRIKADAICRTHAQELAKLLVKLDGNLADAIPKSTKKSKPLSLVKSGNPSNAASNASMQIENAVHTLARRIYKFIYPEQFTVELGELREPSLLDSLKNLSEMVANFQKTIGKTKIK